MPRQQRRRTPALPSTDDARFKFCRQCERWIYTAATVHDCGAVLVDEEIVNVTRTRDGELAC